MTDRTFGTEGWRKVNDLFHRALAEPPDRRDAFILEQAGGDDVLRKEVMSLLESHRHAEEFLERPAEAIADLQTTMPVPASLVGRQLGQYRIQRVLGEGGMGVVYLAEDVRLGRTVALKALAGKYVGDQARRERLRREARAAAALTHPGIATVYALEEFDGQMFIAGEYVPGQTLREELARGPLGALRTIDTALGVARALVAAHERGVVHRDLKPENIIRTPAGDVKILDFGLARFRDLPSSLAHLSDDGMILGTPAYMSPEQIRGGAVDGRSDLFSLGIVIYELVSGVHPFAGSDPASTIARILEAEPARLADLPAAAQWNPAILGALEDIVMTCVRKEADARFRHAQALVDNLEQARLGLSDVASSPKIRSAPASAPAAGQAIWWWQFHEAAASIGYLLLLVPLWMARAVIGGRRGLLLFVVGLVAAVVASTLRSHLWFAVRSYPAEWAEQRAQTRPWIRGADVMFVGALLIGGATLAAVTDDSALGVFLIGAAVAVLLSFVFIEPATTRAAFRR